MANSWGNNLNSDRLYFWGGSKITADGDCSHEIKRCLLLVSSPGTTGPEHRTPPRASPRRPGQLRRSPRRCRDPPGPRLLPFLSTSNFRASREKLKGRAGAERQRGKHPLPLPARLHLGARPWVRRRPLARRGRWKLFLFPSAPRPRARHRRLGRNLPGAYRNLLCGEIGRSTRLNSSHSGQSRMPASA